MLSPTSAELTRSYQVAAGETKLTEAELNALARQRCRSARHREAETAFISNEAARSFGSPVALPCGASKPRSFCPEDRLESGRGCVQPCGARGRSLGRG